MNAIEKPDIIIPRQFARLLDSDWREAAVHGGRGSLKSGTVARILLTRAATKRGRCGCFREFQNSIDDSVHALLKGIVEEYRLPSFKVTDKKIINTVTGYDFVFKGLHGVTVQSIKSIEGMTEAWGLVMAIIGPRHPSSPQRARRRRRRPGKPAHLPSARRAGRWPGT
jgi:phage terminase large subunit